MVEKIDIKNGNYLKISKIIQNYFHFNFFFINNFA